MTFHLNLKGKDRKSEMNPLQNLTKLQNEAEKALSIIAHAESENNISSIKALGRIFAFHHEAHSDDVSFECYKEMCKSKGIKLKNRESNDYSPTLNLFIGNDRKLKTKKSRWKGALLHADSNGIKPLGFEPAISEEDEGIVAWSSKWYRSVMPDQTRRAREKDENYLGQHANPITRPDKLRLEELIEGKDALIIQKRHGKVVLFEARYFSPNEIRRLFRRPIHPNSQTLQRGK